MATRAPDAASDASNASNALGSRLCLGVIGAAHGVRGALRVKTFTQTPHDFAAYGPLTDEKGERVFVVTSCRPAKAGVHITLEGVNDRTAAEALKNTALYVARDKLPTLDDADDFYHSDLIGLDVRDGVGAQIGQVLACHNFGAGDLLEIQFADSHAASFGGKTAFYAFTKAVIPEVNLAERYVTLVPPKEDEARPDGQIAPDKKGGAE
jgi:16S rRNA processing protein RimM